MKPLAFILLSLVAETIQGRKLLAEIMTLLEGGYLFPLLLLLPHLTNEQCDGLIAMGCLPFFSSHFHKYDPVGNTL